MKSRGIPHKEARKKYSDQYKSSRMIIESTETFQKGGMASTGTNSQPLWSAKDTKQSKIVNTDANLTICLFIRPKQFVTEA